MAFSGFDTPKQNWFKLPAAWVNITAGINSLAEVKVIQYVLRHTWGFQEYGIPKKITTDEFMHGRMGRDRMRMDDGTGLSKQSVIDGLRKAVMDGYLVEQVDDRDKGRVKKSTDVVYKPGIFSGTNLCIVRQSIGATQYRLLCERVVERGGRLKSLPYVNFPTCVLIILPGALTSLPHGGTSHVILSWSCQAFGV